jgi:hypothetical protein
VAQCPAEREQDAGGADAAGEGGAEHNDHAAEVDKVTASETAMASGISRQG